MDFYGNENYRDALKALIKEKKDHGSDLNFQKLAEQVRIPKSYVSKVLHGGAHFNADQMFQICAALKLSAPESEFMELLLEWERASHPARKDLLGAKIIKIRSENLKTDSHLKASAQRTPLVDFSEYYLDPRVQVVHIALTLPELSRDTRQLAQRISFPPEVVQNAIAVLTQTRLIECHGHRAKVLQTSLHLKSDSPFFQAWRTQLRFLSLTRLGEIPKDRSLSFSVVFAADEETKTLLRKKLLKFISEAEQLCEKAPREKLCQMNIDLHDWF